MKNIYKRVSKIEAHTMSQKAESMEVLQKAYKNACEAQNSVEAAEFLRKIRNKLLDETDKQMALDRLGLDASSTTKFIASLVKIFNGDWSKYRQELRDITKQSDFPFDVEFPKSPDETDEEAKAIFAEKEKQIES